jgi:hypothetical protein
MSNPTLAQYDRLAEDWRHLSTLIWEIPAVAIAITAGIVGVSYQFLEGVPRVGLLSIGSLFILTLAIAIAKYRLFHESRTRFLQDLEKRIGIRDFPVTSEETKEYLKDKVVTEDWLYNLLNKPHSAIWLIYVVFITSLILGALAIYSSLQIVLASSGNVSANSTSIEGGYNYGALASHPLVLLLIGLLFTGLIIPAVSKQWRKPKELELKVNVISRIGESVANIISAVHLDQVTQLTPHQDFKKAQIKWETDKEVIAAHLQVLFPGSPIIDKWQTFSFAVWPYIH